MSWAEWQIDKVHVRTAFNAAWAKSRELYRECDKDSRVLSVFIQEKLSAFRDQPEVCRSKLETVLSKLKGLKTKIGSLSTCIDESLCKCAWRLEKSKAESEVGEIHMQSDFSFGICEDKVLRIIHEYLLRNNLTSTAAMNYNLLDQRVEYQALIELELAKEDLKKHKSDKALAWCEAHRPQLAKINSCVRTEIYLLESIELMRAGNVESGFKHICDNLSQSDLQKFPASAKYFASFAFSTTDPFYPSINRRWDKVYQNFVEDSNRITGLTSVPFLLILLQIGLTLIKSGACQPGKDNSCPGCMPELADYLSNIPSVHKVHSYLFCPHTGALMTPENPPMASPDGYVYSQKALRKLHSSSADGMIYCPKSRKSYNLTDFVRVYIT